MSEEMVDPSVPRMTGALVLEQRKALESIVITELPGASEFILRGSRVGIERVLSWAGREDVRVASTRQRDGATFHASWSL